MSEVMTPPSANPKRPARRKTSGIVVPHAPRWSQRVAAWLIYALVRAVSLTLRYRWQDRSGFFGQQPAGPAIYCGFHNRLLLSMTAYYGYVRKRNSTAGIAALVSASRDGAFLAAILECFRVEPVRGSSSRRGPQALLELTTWAERGYDLAITPDGPRGPCGKVQEGVMSLAQITGLPIIPFSFQLGWKVRANSWDRFQIPLPFSRCDMILAEALRVPRDTSDTAREELRQQLERKLNEISGD